MGVGKAKAWKNERRGVKRVSKASLSMVRGKAKFKYEDKIMSKSWKVKTWKSERGGGGGKTKNRARKVDAWQRR